jgi:hypothetical protein
LRPWITPFSLRDLNQSLMQLRDHLSTQHLPDPRQRLGVNQSQRLPGDHEEGAVPSVVQPGDEDRTGEGSAELVAAQLGLLDIEEAPRGRR